MKNLCILIFIPLFRCAGQETDYAQIYYDKAVIAFHKMEFVQADSLFSRSIYLSPTKDAYFSRAAARHKMGMIKGYCQDLGMAIQYNDEEAASEFCKICGTADTVYTQKDGEAAVINDYYFKEILYNSQHTGTFSIKTDKFGNASPSKKPNPTQFEVDELPEFPGGLAAVYQYIRKNMILPEGRTDVSGTVLCRFTINEDGRISGVDLAKGISNCPECDSSVLRTIKAMPKWKPAKLKGTPVKMFFMLPVNIIMK